ncbi:MULTISPECIES: hypothetical protein [Lactococcus]|jgi:hypothetical protein|uniref:Uncharacterized protein n=1 Tax=Lactococcus formosensis TaxID=1281486 RepID=A0A9Q8Y498_9LACT|nr:MULTISPECIES: hypothetical protein [Lactococcus]USI66605.1 hypothetical protein LMK05_04810 [Lactococcus petauri]USI69050.1 hypothetical protein LMK04_04745 [Lactococcus petauri]USJ21237.1 hypothetical protein LMK00_04320 [Lactococcus formosensis]WJE13716.1 hypothetical protein QR692_04710 [Lactococcus petauri]
MEQNNMKKCRYPKCDKKVHTENSLFCMDHSREIREKAPSKESLEKWGKNVAIGLAIGSKVFPPIYSWFKNKKG